MLTKRDLLILALCLFALAVISLVYVQGGFDPFWSTVDGGGGTNSGGDYVLSGTAGQADAGLRMQGGTYALSGGFWSTGAARACEVYLPAVLRQSP